MAYTAADVKRLRDETDAPMMECKAALEEAGGDYDRAKEILREKGKAAAGKKAGRATSAGVVAFAASADNKVVGAVVVESETDFVSRNEEFIKSASQIAEYVRDNGGPAGDPMEDAAFKAMAEEIVGKFRENVQIRKALRLTSDSPIATYTHHDRTKGTAILSTGASAGSEPVRKVAVHAVAFPPEVVSKDQLSQEKIEAEIEIEMQRALNEGKDEKIARNIAQGRVNKEFIKRVVLLEQPFYIDPSKSVAQFLAEEAKDTQIDRLVYLAVGEGS